ncbi:MAG: DUF2182 domain-containing protein [Gemmatimonadaceae bacterium]
MMTMPMASPGAAGVAMWIAMWGAMMAAMMLPSLLPMLWRFRNAVRCTGKVRREELAALVACGYFVVWTAYGMTLYLAGIAIGALEVQLPALRRAAPIAIGCLVILVGLHQLSAWKTHHLACCRAGLVTRGSTASASGALLHGVRLGIHCVCDCGPVMALLLVFGASDLRAMALVTAAITAERLAPAESLAGRRRAPGRQCAISSRMS